MPDRSRDTGVISPKSANNATGIMEPNRPEHGTKIEETDQIVMEASSSGSMASRDGKSPPNKLEHPTRPAD